MKYIDEYRKKELIEALAAEIRRISRREIALMEVCGGHTMAIHRFGLHALLPVNIRLISGPGCPVCVSGRQFIDTAVACSEIPGSVVATYGDLIRVPGSGGSLEKQKAAGKDIRIIYSVMDAIEIAAGNPGSNVFFPGIGFETTAPATAAAIVRAKQEDLRNFFVLSAHKIMPPVMAALVMEGVRLDGFIAPGHVSAIAGTDMYRPLANEFGLGVVVAGFEPADILQAILMLVRQLESGKPRVEIQYRRTVRPEGNRIARALLNRVFEPKDDTWRGLGVIPLSGLKIREEYAAWDAERNFDLAVPPSSEPEGCICGSILRGLKTPADCRLFATACTPADPVGACMVSSEGACAAFYTYCR
jgi:hydrogenase expression/formation protein HypD